MSTRAQIGFYDGSDLTTRPVALLYQHSDGYPTSKEAGVVRTLLNICVPIIEQRGSYDPEYLAAQTLFRLIAQYDSGASGLGFGIGNALHGDIRFYYAVTEFGVAVYDARNMVDATLDHLTDFEPMFFTSWKNDEKRRKVEKEIEDLEARLKDLYNQRKSVQLSRP
jgi:hypothetical protein